MDLSLALAKIFPLTFSLLTEKQAFSLQKEFEREWGAEQLHFFPMLIREKQMPSQVIEVADYEYLKHSLDTHSFSLRKSQAPFSLNPSLQFVWIGDSAEVLQKEAGLYALWKWAENVFELKLSREEAKVLDRMQEDQILLRKELDEAEAAVLDHLISLKIVLAEIKETGLNS